MSEIDDLVARIPMAQLAGQLGVDEATAERATRGVLPALLGGMEANAAHPGGERSLVTALGQHDASLLDGLNLDHIDTDDGSKIVRHVFGPNQDQVVHHLAGAGDLGKDLIGKLLPLLAPIVMSWLAKKFQGKDQQNKDQQGGGLGGMLGDLLGGGGLGDLLGGLLGGGRK
jgi:hypothetical protein